MISTTLWAQVAAVSLGASAGALLRWGAGVWFNDRSHDFAFGTLLVNVAGGLMVGVALWWFERSPDETLRLLVVTGFLGGLTTFSAFSAESLLMLQRGALGLAMLHASLHVLGAVGAAALGYRLGRALIAP